MYGTPTTSNQIFQLFNQSTSAGYAVPGWNQSDYQEHQNIPDLIRQALTAEASKEIPPDVDRAKMLGRIIEKTDLVDLSGFQLNDDHVRILVDALKGNTSVKRLLLSGNQISNESVGLLANLLTHNSSLEELDLSKNAITTQGMRRIFESLQNNSTLRTLILDGNTVTADVPEPFIYLAELLKPNHTLTQLSLLDMGRNGELIFSATLHACQADSAQTEVEFLKSGVRFGYRGISSLSISGSLGQMGQIVQLDREPTVHGMVCIKSFLELLKASKTAISSLKCEREDIDADSIAYLTDQLRANDTLRELNLIDCSVKDEGAKSLAELVRSNKALEHLELSRTKIGDNGVIVLSEAMTVNTSVTYLNLGYNHISTNGVSALLKMLKTNDTLTCLGLDYNPISNHDRNGLLEMLKYNTGVSRLFIDPIGNFTEARLDRLLLANNKEFMDCAFNGLKPKLSNPFAQIPDYLKLLLHGITLNIDNVKEKLKAVMHDEEYPAGHDYVCSLAREDGYLFKSDD